MKLYAELPSRRAAQVAGDLLVALAVYALVRLGQAIHDLIAQLAAPGRALAQAGRTFSDQVEQRAGAVEDLPVVGQILAGPFDALIAGGRALADAGAAQQAAVQDVAVALGLVVAGLPIVVLVVGWALVRVRRAREAAAAGRLRDEGADLGLFALRALSHRPLRDLRSVARDPLGAYAAGDVEGLAGLELTALGLRAPHRSA